jgi:phosphatidate cytidylyltransferase
LGSDLKNRLTISLPLVLVVTLAIFYAPGLAALLGGVVLLRSLWEFYQIYRGTQPSFQYWALMYSTFYLWTSLYLSSESMTVIGLLGFCALFGLQMLDSDNRNGMLKISLTLVGFVYIIYLGSHLFRVLNLHSDVPYWGSTVLFTSIFVCKFSDATAYFGGKRFGKRKLIPRISPNKTQEGLLCAYLGALVPVPFLAQLSGFSFFTALGFCVLLATTSFIGDLFESMLKRELNVKDTASDIPAFGGTLDMIDSIILSMPAAYWYIQLMEIQP